MVRGVQKGLNVRIAVVHDVGDGIGEARVSAAFDFRSAFEESDVWAGFVGGESCDEAGVAATDYYHIIYVEGGWIGRGTIFEEGARAGLAYCDIVEI